MLKDRIVFLNGDFVAWSQATVHMMSHSFGRGSAIFEVLGLHDTNAEPMIFRLDKHLNASLKPPNFSTWSFRSPKKRFTKRL